MTCVSDINETILRAIKTIKNEKMKMFFGKATGDASHAT